MSRKQRAKRARARTKTPVDAPKKASPQREPDPDSGATRSVNRLGVVVAIVGLVGLMAFVMIRGESPPRDVVPVAAEAAPESEPDQTDIQKWQAAFLQEVPFSPEKDFALGPEDAPVTLIEFSDFQCPFCRRANAELGRVVELYPDEVRWVFKNFPLDLSCNDDMAQQLHPAACKAAVMARCAGEEDPELFWSMHDALFETDSLSDESLSAIASSLGLTSDSFVRCVQNEETLDAVLADIQAGRELGVNATPTIFVNGRAAPSYAADSLADIIDFIKSSN